MGNLLRGRCDPLLIVLLALTIAVVLLPGCGGYQFGDGTRAVFKFRQSYCSLAPGPLKDAAHEKAKELLGSYPEASWCDGIGFAVDIVRDI